MTITKEALQKYSVDLSTLTTNKDFYYCGDYHKISLSEIDDIIDCMTVDYEYNDRDEVIDELRDRISELSDSAIPIYYKDIAEWFGSNWTAVDEYINETGKPDDFDIMKVIQGAYYISYERDLVCAFEKMIDDFESDTEKNESDEQ